MGLVPARHKPLGKSLDLGNTNHRHLLFAWWALSMSQRALIASALWLAFIQAASADSIYKSTDKDGRVRYSTRAPSADAKPADLPEIMRGEVKLVDQKLVSCDKHGGVNCQAGADADGSVICLDGFRESSARFRFTCSMPKLEVSDISETGVDGEFTVFIRNSKSVDALNPLVSIKTKEGTELRLKGPEKIAAFAIAEFQFKPDSIEKQIPRPNFAEVLIACKNCPTD